MAEDDDDKTPDPIPLAARRRRRGRLRTRDDEDDDLVDEDPAPAPDERLNSLEQAAVKAVRKARWIYAAITVVAIPAIASLVLVARYIHDRAVVETRAEIRIEQDRKLLEQLSADLAEVKRKLSEYERRIYDVEGLAARTAQKLDRGPRSGGGSPP